MVHKVLTIGLGPFQYPQTIGLDQQPVAVVPVRRRCIKSAKDNSEDSIATIGSLHDIGTLTIAASGEGAGPGGIAISVSLKQPDIYIPISYSFIRNNYIAAISSLLDKSAVLVSSAAIRFCPEGVSIGISAYEPNIIGTFIISASNTRNNKSTI